MSADRPRPRFWPAVAVKVIRAFWPCVSVTGSVLVYRVEMDRAFQVQKPTFDATRQRLSADALKAAALRAYPGWEVTRQGTTRSRVAPSRVLCTHTAV